MDDAAKVQRLKDKIKERKAAVPQLQALENWLTSEIDRRVGATAFMVPGHNRQVAQAYSEIAVFRCEREFLPARIAIVQSHIQQLEKEIENAQ